jgi:hypothetical protein
VDWSINISIPMENLNHIITTFIESFWQMKFVQLFHCQILVGSVMTNAFVIIKYLLMIAIIAIPFVLAHLVNSYSFLVCDWL